MYLITIVCFISRTISFTNVMPCAKVQFYCRLMTMQTILEFIHCVYNIEISFCYFYCDKTQSNYNNTFKFSYRLIRITQYTKNIDTLKYFHSSSQKICRICIISLYTMITHKHFNGLIILAL